MQTESPITPPHACDFDMYPAGIREYGNWHDFETDVRYKIHGPLNQIDENV